MTDATTIDHPAPPLSLAQAAESRYLLLRTFRADGTGVDTPIWFAVDGTTIWFRTVTDTAKVRRLRRRPTVELRRCDWRGVVQSTATLTGQAFVADGDPARHAHDLLARRYGWQWNIVPMIPTPGVRSAHQGLGLRDRLRHMRARELWADSSIIGIDCSPG